MQYQVNTNDAQTHYKDLLQVRLRLTKVLFFAWWVLICQGAGIIFAALNHSPLWIFAMFAGGLGLQAWAITNIELDLSKLNILESIMRRYLKSQGLTNL